MGCVADCMSTACTVSRCSLFRSVVVCAQDARVKLRLVTRQFTHRSLFDKNGLLYYIGSAGAVDQYSNPHQSGGVIAKMSSRALDSDPALFVAHQSVEDNSTKENEGEFMAVDLGPYRQFRPTFYCLRNGSSEESDRMLRDWDFQGSADGQQWTSLHSHNRDLALEAKSHSVAGWAIESSHPFQCFRVVRNTKGPVSCSGIELYGELGLKLLE